MSNKPLPPGVLPTDQPDLFFEDNTVGRVKKEITEPLALKRELVKRFHIDENLDKSIRKAAMVVNLMKGASC